jgi:cobalt-precorrin 5A hydrolase
VSEQPLLIAGLGCRRGCTLDELLNLLGTGLAEQGCSPADLTALASSTHKRGAVALTQLASRLQLPLTYLPSSALQACQEQCTQGSALALRVSGSASVAEASALALARLLGGASSRLLLSKRKSANATLAVAVVGKHP